MASPKRSFVPLFLILSLSAIFLLSLHNSSSSSSLYSAPAKTFASIKSSDLNPNFTLTVKVLAYDRLNSLSRCLKSLSTAHYDTNKVNLHIYIDHFRVPENESVELDLKLNESRRILDFVDGFEWKFGDKLVHYRTGNVGLQAQWLEAWWPSSNDEFAFVVEDDLEVSPLYYRFLRALIVHYYYNASNFSPLIYGASLQRPRFVPGKHGNKMQLDSENRLFLYQLVGTWGQLLFPRPWKEFRLWYDIHKTKGMKPFLDGMVTTGWYKRMGEKIWTPWFIKFIHTNGYFNIYTNFLHKRALSVSHRDAGVNYGKTAGPDSYLIDQNTLDFNLLEMQPLSNLKWYDFCFRQVFHDKIVNNFDELGPVLQSVQKSKTIIVVSSYGGSNMIIKNMLCQFESLNIRNYVLLGPKSDFLLDLARKGHAVVDAEPFFTSVTDFQGSGFDQHMKEMVVKAYVIKKSLELGYKTWVLDSNLIPVNGNFFLDSFDTTHDFSVGKKFNLVFVKNPLSASAVWLDFVLKVAKPADSLGGKGFGYVVEKFLEGKGIKFDRVDEMGFAADINSVDLNQKKLIFWSLDVDFDSVKKRLQEQDVWLLDHDFSCRAVVCHPS